MQNDSIDFAERWNAATAGNWRTRLQARLPRIRDALRSVGRVDLVDGSQRNAIGTAFLIAPNRVLTNKHVLQDIAFRDGGQWRFIGRIEVEFAGELDVRRERLCLVTGVHFASRDAISEDIELAKMDVAILDIAPAGSDPLPPPLSILADDTELVRGAETYLVGYPAVADDALSSEDVRRTFGTAIYGRKRLSPGTVIDGPLTFEDGNTPNRVFTHDCSTLGGSSGSCVLDLFEGGRYAVGLHFGGLKEAGANCAHALQRLRDPLEAAGATYATPRG